MIFKNRHRVRAGNDVIGVVVVYGAALVEVAAEDGWVGRPVTLVTAGLPDDKTAVDADAFFELEGGGPFIVNCSSLSVSMNFGQNKLFLVNIIKLEMSRKFPLAKYGYF